MAELSVAQKLLESADNTKFYQETFDYWKETGEIHDRQAIIDMFENAPQDSLPVYYSMVGKLGLLPKHLAAEIVQYHANIVALPKAIVRFLGKRQLDRPIVQEIAKSIEQQFNENTRLRKKLMTELADFAAKPVRLLPERTGSGAANLSATSPA